MDHGSETLKQYGSLFDFFLQERVAPFLREEGDSNVVEPALYSLLAGGKRFRPFLVMISAGYPLPKHDEFASLVSNPHDASLLWTAASVELIHTYSLIHDDLPSMDNDTLRRGKPTCHVEFSEWAAILAGDALNTTAFQLLSEAWSLLTFPPAIMIEMLRVLSRGAGLHGMVSGQGLDLHAEKNGDDFLSDAHCDKREYLQRVHLKKSAALIAASCTLGALFSGAAHIEHYHSYGEKLGLLFQISDDILDIMGDKKSLGKTPGKDAKSGKLTYPGLYGLESAMEKCEELVSELTLQAAELMPPPKAKMDMRHIFSLLPSLIAKRKS